MTDTRFNIAISKEALAAMPQAHFPGSITVVDTPEGIEAAIARLYAQPVVGFDTETRPNFHKGDSHKVSLMQVSTLERCWLFRLNHTGLNDTLVKWLSDDSRIKVGLSLKDDFHQLRQLREFEPGGFVELQKMVRDYHITDASLQKIYGILFGRRISKGQRLTNWEAPHLAAPQQSYAALDAYACLVIYNYLTSGAFNPESSPYILKPEEAPDPTESRSSQETQESSQQ